MTELDIVESYRISNKCWFVYKLTTFVISFLYYSYRVSSVCVSMQDAQTAQSLLKLADLARDTTSYGNNVRVDGLHRVYLLEVARGHVAEDLALE
jgi:hypothetical protein